MKDDKKMKEFENKSLDDIHVDHVMINHEPCGQQYDGFPMFGGTKNMMVGRRETMKQR